MRAYKDEKRMSMRTLTERRLKEEIDAMRFGNAREADLMLAWHLLLRVILGMRLL